MALVLYHDEACTQEITDENPDEIKEAVQSGSDLVDEKLLYMKSDDTDLTYENIKIEKDSEDQSPSVTLEYAPDEDGSPGTYVSVYEPADGKYETVHKVWRRVTVTNVTEAFEREDISHQITADEYIA